MQVQITTYGPHLQWAYTRILRRLRMSDRREFALFGVDPTAPLTNLAEATTPFSEVVTLDGSPAFIFGASQTIPGVFQLWGFGTRETPLVMDALTDFILTTFGPRLFFYGARRIQVYVPLKSKRSLEWLSGPLGMRIETIMPHYCTDGSPLVQLVYTQNDYERLRSEKSEYVFI